METDASGGKYLAHTEGEGVLLSGSQIGGGKPDAPLGGCVWEEAKLKVFRCEAYMLCPVQRGPRVGPTANPKESGGGGPFCE